MFVAEKGIELDEQFIDIYKGEHFSAEFKKKSPLWDVPVLELDDGTCISQINAICRFLEDMHPEPALYGQTPEERAEVSMWNHIGFINGMQAIAEVARNSMEAFENRAVLGTRNYAQIPALAERGVQRMIQFMEEMDTRLSNSQYIGGAAFSVADITAFVAIDLGITNGIAMPEGLSHLENWHANINARPSAKA